MSILFGQTKGDENLERLIQEDAEAERIKPTQKLRQLIFKHYENDPRLAKIKKGEPAEAA